ncbi:MAG: bifunctional (p)ppGpp synthetase/guanosine-3',5'-bis(diphosphate) 3'-pyrophosphohydrolase [Gammaproteobacteria bacterium]|nr:GTP diphosphokinase [Gammaproteobacteria bacterium]
MQAVHTKSVHDAEAERAAAQRLARIEAAVPAAQPACARGRALLGIVAGLTDDTEILEAAALLPVLESGAIDEEAAGRYFGAESVRMAAELIRIDTLGRKAWKPGGAPSGEQVEALRKMLLAIFGDPRLLLVRLAAQLARMREVKRGPAEERERLALETREVYAPLANRLGVWQLKWELEDLAFRYLEPENYHRVAGWLAAKRADRERYVAEVSKIIANALEQAGIRASVTGRPKHIYSIWRKMQRKGLSFDQLYDLRAVRILVDSVADCYAALGVVHGLWPHIPGEFDDYIATPKSNGYQSLHTAVVGPEKLPVEIQIRTWDMHDHAELGVAAHWRYKEGTPSDRSFEQKIAWLRQLLDPADVRETDGDFLERVRAEIFEDRVYVLSPRGEVIELPRGATPLDYAYQVHTGLGHRCRGAKVNGRIVPLDRPLSNGDQVEIIAGKQPNPSRDWLVPSLGYLVSPRHRAKVRAWFRKQDEAQNRAAGRQILERELQRLGVREVPLAELAAEFHYETPEQLFQAIGEGEVTGAQIAGALQRRLREEEPAPIPSRRPTDASADTSSIRIEGAGDLLSTFAKCCRPVPPEPITGYITVGRGVTVHRKDCPNLRVLEERRPHRVIAVDWGSRGDRAFPVDVNVRAFDRRGLLRDISSVLADSKIDIRAMTTSTQEQEGTADVNLTIAVQDLEELSRVLARIQSLPNVLSAERRA